MARATDLDTELGQSFGRSTTGDGAAGVQAAPMGRWLP